MPQFGHKHWQTHFGKTFDVYTRVNVIVFRKSVHAVFVSVFWLAFLVSFELTTEILNLMFFFYQLWKFQQKYRYTVIVNNSQ